MKTKIDLEAIYQRNELIWGKEAQKALFQKHVIVFGLGGVGSYVAEALARSGIGKLTLVDFDTVAESNINRQLLALVSEIGKPKVELMKNRIENINPHIQQEIINDFYTTKLNKRLFNQQIDFVIDAIDSLKAKVDLIETCIRLNIPLISSMGAGNRIDPAQLYISDLSEIKSKNCPFAKNVIQKLKQRRITEGFAIVASTEKPVIVEKRESFVDIKTADGEEMQLRKFTPGSTPFVPPAAGYLMASYVVRKLIF